METLITILAVIGGLTLTSIFLFSLLVMVAGFRHRKEVKDYYEGERLNARVHSKASTNGRAQ